MVTARYLSEKYHLSTRTIYRYIDTLSMSNIPIATKMGRNGGIYILNTYELNTIYLSVEEKFLLQTAVATIQNSEIKSSLCHKLNL